MIGIFTATDTSTIRGPQKVVSNLLKGLELLKTEFRINQLGDFNGCLNNHRVFLGNLPYNTLMGPNLVVNPPDDPYLFLNYKKILVPSEMVMENYKKFDVCNSTKFFVHPTGIETEKWNEKKNIERDCLIYFKNREEKELFELKKFLEKLNISYYIIRYGEYDENTFREILSKIRYTILLTNTESQGIAYMEILSTNTPCFVFNKIYDDGLLRGESVQYFSNECGLIFDKSLESDFSIDFEKFLDNLAIYEPRKYILENFTLEKSAKKYLEFLRYE